MDPCGPKHVELRPQCSIKTYSVKITLFISLDYIFQTRNITYSQSFVVLYVYFLQQISLGFLYVAYPGSISTDISHAAQINMAPGRRQNGCTTHMLNIQQTCLRFAQLQSHAKHETDLLGRWNCQVILQQFKLCSAVTSNLKDMITLAYSIDLYELMTVLIFPLDKATVSRQPS